MAQEPNWKASGRPQQKSPGAPKKIKRYKKRIAELRKKLKRQEDDNSAAAFFVCVYV